MSSIPARVLQVLSQQEIVESLESALAEQQSELQFLTEHIKARQANEVAAGQRLVQILSGRVHNIKFLHYIKPVHEACKSFRPLLSKSVCDHNMPDTMADFRRYLVSRVAPAGRKQRG